MDKFLFINIPKNASTSLYEAFKDYDVLRKNEHLFPSALGIFHPRHVSLEQFAEKCEEIDILKILIVCCVRNPFERIVSAYEFANRNELWRLYQATKPTFSDFAKAYCEKVEDQEFFHAWSQTKWLRYKNEIRSDIILRFETLKEDYEALAFEFKLNLPQLPHLNGNQHKAWEFYYDNTTADMVYSAYRDDFENFNYSEEI